MNKYVGNELQLFGVEQMRLDGGKGDGMRILNVRNGMGLELLISVDRAADIARVTFKGDNMSYFSPCGWVAPEYYDKQGLGFLKSFTAGFMTTCGLTSVGNPCVDDGEEVGLHGTVSHIPCENIGYWTADDGIHIKAIVRDARIFSYHLVLEREYICSLTENTIYLKDKVKNIGRMEAPLQIMYHCNMGYPLLSENAIVKIPAENVLTRDEHAAKFLDKCLTMEEPQADFQECCYYHEMTGKPTVSIFNPDINKGMNMTYDTSELKCFTEWKMMGKHDYVLGLEPGNCYPDGRDVMREQGMLEFLKPGEEREFNVKFEFITR